MDERSVLVIPLDCWGVISTFFSEGKDLISLSTSIRGFYEHIKKNDSLDLSNIVFSLLDIPSETTSNITHVQNLEIPYPRKKYKEIEENLFKTLTIFMNLRILEIKLAMNIKTHLISFGIHPHLRKLSIRLSSQTSRVNIIETERSKLPELEYLKVRGGNFEYTSTYFAITEVPTKLRSLILVDVNYDNMELIRKNNKYHKLDLENLPSFEPLENVVKNLHHLELSNMELLPLRIKLFNNVLSKEHFPELRVLKNRNNIGSAPMEIRNLRDLEVIELCHNFKVEVDFDSVISSKLRRFVCKGNKGLNFDKDIVHKIVKTCPILEHLDFTLSFYDVKKLEKSNRMSITSHERIKTLNVGIFGVKRIEVKNLPNLEFLGLSFDEGNVEVLIVNWFCRKSMKKLEITDVPKLHTINIEKFSARRAVPEDYVVLEAPNLRRFDLVECEGYPSCLISPVRNQVTDLSLRKCSVKMFGPKGKRTFDGVKQDVPNLENLGIFGASIGDGSVFNRYYPVRNYRGPVPERTFLIENFTNLSKLKKLELEIDLELNKLRKGGYERTQRREPIPECEVLPVQKFDGLPDEGLEVEMMVKWEGKEMCFILKDKKELIQKYDELLEN